MIPQSYAYKCTLSVTNFCTSERHECPVADDQQLLIDYDSLPDS